MKRKIGTLGLTVMLVLAFNAAAQRGVQQTERLAQRTEGTANLTATIHRHAGSMEPR